MTEHLLTLFDLSPERLRKILNLAIELKRDRGSHSKPLAGKTIVVLLEKSSTRTRLSFEVGIHELGAMPSTLIARDTQLGRGEPLSDTARMLSRYAHGVVYRTHGHARVEELAANASIPVINGLTDLYHPCQLLADVMTMMEQDAPLEAQRVAWIGDGNNMAHSWMAAATLLGFELRVCTPEAYAPDPGVVERSSSSIRYLHDPREACEGATVVTTDVWTSMGQEDEQRARLDAFAGYQVDEGLMKRADADAIFLHCLPAHRGEEVSAEVIDGPASRVWDQAENRLHSQKALLVEL